MKRVKVVPVLRTRAYETLRRAGLIQGQENDPRQSGVRKGLKRIFDFENSRRELNVRDYVSPYS